MDTIIALFLSISIIISLLHLVTSVSVISAKLKKGNSKELENNTDTTIPYYPTVSILKPLKGIDDELEDNLRSFFILDYPNYEIICGVEEITDPSVEIINKLKAEYPLQKCTLVINNNKIGLNPKVNNMHNIYQVAQGKYILINDSNTKVKKDFLKKMIREFDEENIGLVTSTIKGIGAENAVSVWENFYLNTFVAPNVFVAEKFSNISIVIGKSILMPNKVLQKIGGFVSVANYLAEDFMLGQKVEALGYKVKTSLTIVENINKEMPLKTFLNRHTRWAKIRRNISLKNYFLEWFSNPILIALMLVLHLRTVESIAFFFIVIMLKMFYEIYIMKILNSNFVWHNVFSVPFKDFIIAVIWFVPFFSYKVKWRENKIKIGRDSILQSI